MNTAQNITLSLDPETIELLKQLAKKDDRTMSAMVRVLIKQAAK